LEFELSSSEGKNLVFGLEVVILSTRFVLEVFGLM
jgi:hypothetical protein